MKKLIICLLITLTGLLGQNAWAQGSNVTVTKPSSSGFVTVKKDGQTYNGTELSADAAKKYLEDICGLVGTTSGNTTTWSYKKDNGDYVKPKSEGDVFFVEVNDYWMGVNNQNTADYYDQISKGVKKISAVDGNSSQETTSGKFYTYPATNASKFFFIVRRLDKAKSPRNESIKRVFGWYDEWSYVTDTDVNGSKGWDALEPTWDMLMDGTPFPSPHNCSSSLETNHFTALDGKNPLDNKGGHDFTAYLYIPKKCKDGTEPSVTYEITGSGKISTKSTTYYIYNSDSYYYDRASTSELTGVFTDANGSQSLAEAYEGKYYSTSYAGWGGSEVKGYPYENAKKVVKEGECPYVFFYAVGLNGALGAKQTSAQYNPYTVNLDWSTAFDKFATNGVQQHAKYDGGGDATKGIQEHYLVERSYDKTNWETVTDQIIVQGNNVTNKADYKKTTDSQLKKFDETTEQIGYTVYYRVTSYVEKLTSDGTPGTRMSKTESNIVRVDIPGKVPFKLTLAGEGSSVYNPTTTNNGVEYGNATNTFTNTIISAESTVEDAEKVELTSKAVLTLNAVDADGNITKVLYRVANPTGNTSLDALAKLIDNVNAAGKEKGEYRDAMTLLAGDKMTAAYQLKLEILGENNNVESQTFSNILRINNTAIGMDETVKAHRSGYPDAATCVTDNEGMEVFHNEIKFKASTRVIDTGYYIYKDAKSSDPTDPSNYWKKLIYSAPDEQGNERFREDGTTNYYYPDSKGYLTITDIFESAPIAVGEDENAENDVLANVYSVAFYDGKGNTYGSPRGDALYEGNQDELTLSVSATLRAANFRPADNYNVHVNIFVNWNATMAGKYNDVNPQSVTVWLKNKNEDALPLDEVVESSMAPMAMATEYSFVGQTEYTHEVTAEGDVSGTITIPHIYKSKWQSENGKKYTADELLQSLTGAETIEEGQKLETNKYEVYVKMTTTSGAVKNSFVAIPQVEAGAIYTGIEGIEAADMDVKVVNGVVEVSGVTGVIKVVNTIGAVVAEAEGNGEVTEIEGLSSGVYVVTAKNMKPTKILIK